MKKKKIVSLIIILILIIGIIIISFPKKNNKIVSKSNSINTFTDSSMITLMIEKEAGSGEYEQSSSTTWPEGSYDINEEKSKCENGGTLTFDTSTKKVILKTNISDKCYVYFDISAGDLKMTVTYNGTAGAPTTVGPQATLSCNGTSAVYNNQYNRIEVNGISSASAKCNLTYTDRTSKTYLNNKIISLAGTTQGTGQVVNENGYRYEGKDPNNYIWFNNELWRIIGVFDSTSHGQSGQNLVKIIREESLGSLAWNKINTNDWSVSNLKKLLNPISGDSNSGAYYNKINGTNSGYCYNNSIQSNCDYRVKGIDAAYRPMIKNVTWYLGGMSDITKVSAIYTTERGTKGGGSNTSLTNDTGYIGLMYLSDYGYSVLASSCARTLLLSSYNRASCAGQSWLYGRGWEETIMPSYDSPTFTIVLSPDGVVGSANAYDSNTVRPVLYLDSNVYYISGDGSASNPYIIGM